MITLYGDHVIKLDSGPHKETSPGFRNRGISGPKNGHVLYRIFYKQECIPVGYLPSATIDVMESGGVSAQGRVKRRVGSVCPGGRVSEHGVSA